MADFGRSYLKRVKAPLFAALGPDKAAALLFQCFSDLKISPFMLNASAYHSLATYLAQRLEKDKLLKPEVLQALQAEWCVDDIPKTEILDQDEETPQQGIALPSDPDSICQLVSELLLDGSIPTLEIPENADAGQKKLVETVRLIFDTFAILKSSAEDPQAAQTRSLLASQLERYERITSFSRQINTVDLERLREKFSLLPEVLGVAQTAVLLSEDRGVYDPFYLSMPHPEDDLSLGMLLASIAQEVDNRRASVSGFELEFADTYAEAIEASGLPACWLAVPLLVEDHFLGAIIVFDEMSDLYTEDEANVVLRVCNHIASAVKSCAQHNNVTRLQRRLDEELKGVGSVQNKLLPQELPQLRTCKVSAFYRPSGRASGDYYDVVKISDNVLSFIVADVSGHGAPAAVIMAMTKTAFRLFLKQSMSIDQIMPHFNDYLCETLTPEMFVTALAGRIDVVTGALSYVSAGHCPAIIYHAKTKQCDFLSKGAMLMGVLPSQEYHVSFAKLEEGDKLIVYTDGFTDAKNEANEQFGVSRLVDVIKEGADLSADELRSVIVATASDFLGPEPPDDDMTLLIFSF